MIAAVADGDSIKITLHIFAGRSDPVWSIDQSNRNFYTILNTMTGVHSTDLASRLGYKGFSVNVLSGNLFIFLF